MSRERSADAWVPVVAAALLIAGGCGGAAQPHPPETPPGVPPAGETEVEVEREKEQAFPSEPPTTEETKSVSFPAIARSKVADGLEVNTVRWETLPVVYLRLVIKSGREADPEDLPGLSHLVAKMLEEGTKSRTSAKLAREVETLGADLWTGSDEENVYIAMRTLSDHLDEALEILSDVAMNPAFRRSQLDKLKKRELDRLALQKNDPEFLARRTLHRRLYGEHPYAHIDTTEEAVEDVTRRDLFRWHRQWARPNNAFLVAVGDTTSDELQSLAKKEFAEWDSRDLEEVEYPEPPTRAHREVVVVDRPKSVQSVIQIGHLAIPRNHEDWVPLQVANQVLGGSPASRLFMDLRERRGLTYGAYSDVGERVEVAPFHAHASVRNQVTGEAVSAFFHHLERIRTEAPPPEELADAKRYLSDSFPLKIDTPGKIAQLTGELRIFGLADDYWDEYRARIEQVPQDEVLAAAKEHVRPAESLVVVVARAADVVDSLRKWGPVTVVDPQGEVLERFENASGEDGEPAAASRGEAEGGEGDEGDADGSDNGDHGDQAASKQSAD